MDWFGYFFIAFITIFAMTCYFVGYAIGNSQGYRRGFSDADVANFKDCADCKGEGVTFAQDYTVWQCWKCKGLGKVRKTAQDYKNDSES